MIRLFSRVLKGNIKASGREGYRDSILPSTESEKGGRLLFEPFRENERSCMAIGKRI